MFWSLFIIIPRALDTESASVVDDDEQSDIFYFVGPHRNLHYLQLAQDIFLRRQTILRPSLDDDTMSATVSEENYYDRDISRNVSGVSSRRYECLRYKCAEKDVSTSENVAFTLEKYLKARSSVAVRIKPKRTLPLHFRIGSNSISRRVSGNESVKLFAATQCQRTLLNTLFSADTLSLMHVHAENYCQLFTSVMCRSAQ